MDQIKTGKFIAQLRREHGLTQEQLGTRLGVTNKTVSRWENGNYMPDIDTLVELSKVLEAGIMELLEGRRLEDKEYRVIADMQLSRAAHSKFSGDEQVEYWKRKFLRERWPSWVLLVVLSTGGGALLGLMGPVVTSIAGAVACFAAWREAYVRYMDKMCPAWTASWKEKSSWLPGVVYAVQGLCYLWFAFTIWRDASISVMWSVLSGVVAVWWCIMAVKALARAVRTRNIVKKQSERVDTEEEP